MKSPPRDLVVRVTDPPGREHVGVVVDSRVLADMAFLMVGLPVRSAPSLPVGGTTDVVLEGEPLSDGLDVEAWVTFRSEGQQHRNYELILLSNGLTLADALATRPTPAFAPRSADPPTARVQAAEVRGANGAAYRIDAPLIDVSATGMVLQVDLEQEGRLATTRRLSLSVSLPGEEDQLDVEAQIGNRRLRGASVLYDLDLLVAETPDYYSQEDRMRRYLRMTWKD